MQCMHVGQQDLQIQSTHVHSVLKILQYIINLFHIPERFQDRILNHHEWHYLLWIILILTIKIAEIKFTRHYTTIKKASMICLKCIMYIFKPKRECALCTNVPYLPVITVVSIIQDNSFSNEKVASPLLRWTL